MRLDDIQLRDLLDGLKGGGTLTFAGQRTLLLDATALGLLRAQLIELLGETAARGILTRFGYAHGWRTAETMREAIPWEDMRDWKRAGGVLHRLQGLVDDRPTKKTDRRNRAEARWHRSYEAQQHKLHVGLAHDATCWTLTGFASGYMSRAYGEDIFCVETRCEGKGDSHCHMIGRTRTDWGTRIDDIEPWYEKDCLDAALGVLRERLVAEEARWIARRRDQDVMVDGVGHEVVARSAKMREAVDLALRVAIVDTSVLLTGETGTGKECLARMIHEHGQRANGPFLAINCGALPENLLESELFGHARGAFTGADHERPGLFEAAAGGTLFLDEIGEIAPATQVRLLRVLQEREVRRLGENHARPIDVRVIAATHRDLSKEIREGRFREDLFYRLKVIEVPLAPLRERRADVLPLARLFLDQMRERLDRAVVQGFDRDVQRALATHTWPGNVRELQNAVEHAVALAAGSLITLDDLPADVLAAAPVDGAPINAAAPDVHATLDQVEREHVLRVLNAVDGNRSEAARRLGIASATLYRKLKKYDVS